MSRTITIDPVTRIEGHARITLHLDADGHLVEARFHVLEFRGFERFCEGRPFSEMAGITARICGICPVSHLLTAARTGDRLLAVRIPPAAVKLRRLLNLAQISQSHALSFFHLSSPDLLLGWECDPARRNLFGLIAAEPELARAGIRLRRFGQQIIERLAGRRIHSAWAVPGGVRSPLSPADRDAILEDLPEARATAQLALARFKHLLDGPLQRELHSFGAFPSLFLALVGPGGRWEHLDGDEEEEKRGNPSVDSPRHAESGAMAAGHGQGGRGGLRLIAADGSLLADELPADHYHRFLAEAVEPWSYLKVPYYRPLGLAEGMLRVGPLARLNVCEAIGSPWADAELCELRQRCGRVVCSSFASHLARLVEIVACLEGIEALLHDPQLQDPHVRARAGLNRLEAVGVGEAPRGTLLHHYRVNQQGLIERMNLIIATGLNNLAMNRTVLQIAREVLPDPIGAEAEIPEPLLNRIEAGIRCFDPCLSCSTHAAGSMPLRLEIRDAGGALVAMRQR
jgi:NAD-reducing hydrogenase large subunit